MSSLVCFPQSLTLTNKPNNSPLLFRHNPRPNSVSFSVRSQAKEDNISFSKSSPIILPSFPKLSSRKTSLITTNISAPATILTQAKANKTVEHIVLFKMKEGYNNYEVFISAMNSLRCLPGVLYLSSGYIHDIHSSPLEGFNVFLHSRHASKEHLDAYMGHMLKYGFTMTYTEPYYQDYMIIDYVHEHDDALDHPSEGSALRTVFFKLKDGWGPADKSAALQVASKHLQGSVAHTTFGDSYEGTTYRPTHKGFQVGALALYPSVEELKALGPSQGFAKNLEGELLGFLTGLCFVKETG